MYKKYFKRIFDLIVSLIALIIILPIFIIVYICIKLEDGGPVIYKQVRTGKNGKNFNMYKFRSMSVATEKNGKKLKHKQRVTKVGNILRKTSIDELPQVVNVLKGEMSIIGPRAWIPEYYANFNKKQKHRCDVLPGITGLAQARGRNGLTIFEKINYDLEYTNNLTFKMDLRIIFESIIIIFKREHAEIVQEDIETELEQLRNQ